jgi:hypothetical protein
MTAGTRLDGVITNIKSIISAENAKFSTATRDSLDKSASVQTEISKAIDDINEQQKTDEPFDFEVPEEALA